MDNDGDLDLYITNYKRLAMRDSLPPPIISFDNTLMELTNNRWIVMPPFNKEYETAVQNNILLRFEMAEVDQFYLNDGRGKFELIDITLLPNSQNKLGATVYVAPFAQSKIILNFLSLFFLFSVLFKYSEYLPEASSNRKALPVLWVLFANFKYFFELNIIFSTFLSTLLSNL